MKYNKFFVAANVIFIIGSAFAIFFDQGRPSLYFYISYVLLLFAFMICHNIVIKSEKKEVKKCS